MNTYTAFTQIGHKYIHTRKYTHTLILFAELSEGKLQAS